MLICSILLQAAEREREKFTKGGRVTLSSVGLWEGFLGVKITRSPYLFFRLHVDSQELGILLLHELGFTVIVT